jgi:CRISPR-associated protein Csx17
VPEHRLAGCRVEPLGSYLKALGILRLVSEQADPTAAGWWSGDEFWLRTKLSKPDLIDFFVDSYSPTPLLAPWNNGSGFGEKDNANSGTAVAAVDRIESASVERLASYRKAIAAVQRLRTRQGWYSLEKEQQVALCRNELPDNCVEWLDAAVVLTSESRAFPPLLGTGGNDGRFDFGSNFMQRLGELFGLVERGRGAASATDLARSALFADAAVRLDRAAIGQFDPAGAGGPGSSPMGSAESLSNPWDFVLLLEGAIVFSSAAARRLSGQQSAAVPFIVSASGAGYPSSADAENSRGELWAPLWTSPTRFVEIERLVSEGRAELNGRQATSGIDLARSLATLGVDRGVTSFVRHGFMERNGLATFAVPLGRIDVTERKGAAVLADIDRWASQLRFLKNPPDSLGALLRRLDNAQFAVATGGGAVALQDVLVTIASIESLAVRSQEIREKTRRLSGLAARDWLPLLDDGSVEFELAAALASLRTRGSGRSWIRVLTTPPLDGPGRPAAVPGAGRRPLEAVLADCLARLAIGRPIADVGADQFSSHWLNGARPLSAGLSSVEAVVSGATDDARLASLLAACSILDWSGGAEHLGREYQHRESPTNAAFAALAPFFHPQRTAADGQEPLIADVSWPRRLIAGGKVDVVADALRRLRIAGFETVISSADIVTLGVDGLRLAAACLVPLSNGASAALAARCVVSTSSSQNSPTKAEAIL